MNPNEIKNTKIELNGFDSSFGYISSVESNKERGWCFGPTGFGLYWCTMCGPRQRAATDPMWARWCRPRLEKNKNGPPYTPIFLYSLSFESKKFHIYYYYSIYCSSGFHIFYYLFFICINFELNFTKNI